MAEKKKPSKYTGIHNANRSAVVIGTKESKHLKEGKEYKVTPEQADALVKSKQAKKKG